jgi:hypothetical protein
MVSDLFHAPGDFSPTLELTLHSRRNRFIRTGPASQLCCDFLAKISDH